MCVYPLDDNIIDSKAANLLVFGIFTNVHGDSIAGGSMKVAKIKRIIPLKGLATFSEMPSNSFLHPF